MLAESRLHLGAKEAGPVTGNGLDTLDPMGLEASFFFDGAFPIGDKGVDLEVPIAQSGVGASDGGSVESEVGECGKERSATGEQSSREDCEEEMPQSEIGTEGTSARIFSSKI
jgi:hypothetical protein